MDGDQRGRGFRRHRAGASSNGGQANRRVRRRPANLHVVASRILAREIHVEDQVAQGAAVFVRDRNRAG